MRFLRRAVTPVLAFGVLAPVGAIAEPIPAATASTRAAPLAVVRGTVPSEPRRGGAVSQQLSAEDRDEGWREEVVADEGLWSDAPAGDGPRTERGDVSDRWRRPFVVEGIFGAGGPVGALGVMAAWSSRHFQIGAGVGLGYWG